MKLQGRVALVTGASRGIGRAIALALAREGAAVAVGYRSKGSEAEAVVAEVKALQGKAVALQADVSDYAQAETLVTRTVEELGGLHILVNNAGVTRNSLIYRMGPDDWADVMQANFGGVVHCTKAALAHFMPQHDGVIVNVSSMQTEFGVVGTSLYTASKAAINAFTRSSAVELARFGIRVNAVLPGYTPTEMVQEQIDKNGKAMLTQIPIRRFPDVDEVANVALFLAGPDASYMVGCLVPVDGGSALILAAANAR